MEKKLAGIFIIMILIGVAVNGYSNEKIDIDPDKDITFPPFDEIDQQQIIYNASTCLLGSMLFVQSFEPELDTLTRVKLFMNKFGSLYGNSILTIRESLTGDNLTFVKKESVEINEDFEWIEFDFPDIKVTPGDSYYIILKPDPDSDGGNEFNYISWAFGWQDFYPKGSPFQKYNGSWIEGIPGHSSADYTFKTFGFNENIEDVEISISAGNFGQYFGFGVSIDVLNYRTEDITIDYGYIRDRYFINDFPDKHSDNFEVPSEEALSNLISIGDIGRIYKISIYASFKSINVTRNGMSICELVILFS